MLFLNINLNEDFKLNLFTMKKVFAVSVLFMFMLAFVAPTAVMAQEPVKTEKKACDKAEKKACCAKSEEKACCKKADKKDCPKKAEEKAEVAK